MKINILHISKKKHVFTKIPFVLCLGEASSTNALFGGKGTGNTHLHDFASLLYHSNAVASWSLINKKELEKYVLQNSC